MIAHSYNSFQLLDILLRNCCTLYFFENLLGTIQSQNFINSILLPFMEFTYCRSKGKTVRGASNFAFKIFKNESKRVKGYNVKKQYI